MKQNDNGEALTMERQMELYPGIAIYKVHIDCCREQDKNARVMGKETFGRLQSTIGRDQRLESMPFGHIVENGSGNKEFKIISGHHRTRAARMAGVTTIYVMVDETGLTEDQIKAKQLAHNALAGEDDPQMLKDIYDSISDVNAKIDAGILDVELDKDKFKSVAVDDISLEFDFQQVRMMFLPSQFKKFEEVVKELQKEDIVLLADMKDWDQFALTLRELSKVDDIRNVSSIIAKMCDIVLEYVKVRAVENGEKEVKGGGAIGTRKAGEKTKEKLHDRLKTDTHER